MASKQGGVRGLLSRIAERASALPGAPVVLAVRKRYSGDSADFVAAGITYYGFLSIFPLLLVALSIVGFILAAHPTLQAEWTQRLAGTIPGLGSVVGNSLDALVGDRAQTGIIGFLGLLWSGKQIVLAATHGLARVHRFDESAGFVQKQLWTFGSLFGLGLLALASAGLGAAVGRGRAGTFPAITFIIGGLLALAADFVLFLVAYRVLSRRNGPRFRRLWPGALLAGTGWTVLKIIGGWYATRTVSKAEAVYGTFAGTVGLLVLLYLASRLFMYGAELNAVLIEREVPDVAEARSREKFRERRTAAGDRDHARDRGGYGDVAAEGSGARAPRDRRIGHRAS
ncbi:MAG: YihY/virulence factor BrkB family protein [Actinomycetota bacterium]|nr:YihY/virulence factor BrkB family protein [Actinomycetota bacterium]